MGRWVGVCVGRRVCGWVLERGGWVGWRVCAWVVWQAFGESVWVGGCDSSASVFACVLVWSLCLDSVGLTFLLTSACVFVLFHDVSMIFHSRIDIPPDLGVCFSIVSRCVYDLLQSD